jgi:hypothetical protein
MRRMAARESSIEKSYGYADNDTGDDWDAQESEEEETARRRGERAEREADDEDEDDEDPDEKYPTAGKERRQQARNDMTKLGEDVAGLSPKIQRMALPRDLMMEEPGQFREELKVGGQECLSGMFRTCSHVLSSLWQPDPSDTTWWHLNFTEDRGEAALRAHWDKAQ